MSTCFGFILFLFKPMSSFALENKLSKGNDVFWNAETLPFGIKCRYKVTAGFLLFFGTALNVPFILMRHVLFDGLDDVDTGVQEPSTTVCFEEMEPEEEETEEVEDPCPPVAPCRPCGPCEK